MNKKTKIPQNWQQIKLGDILKVGSGKDYKHLKKGNIPVFGTGGYMLSVDKAIYSGETVFIGRKGTINKPFYYKGDFWTVDTLFYTHNYKNTTAKYINFVFQKINWLVYNEASGVPSLSKTTIEKINFLLPPLPEQSRIISVLETWDQAIDELTKKIKLKKQLKKDLMQKLLTGEIRLPGFSDKWQSIDFLRCINVLTKISGEKKSDYLNEGKYPIIDQSQNLIAGYSNNNKLVNKIYPVIIFGDHTRIVKFVNFQFILGNDGTKVFTANDNIDLRFVYFILLTLNIPNTGYNRHFKYIKDLIFKIPSFIEQTSISDILTKADEEIDLLQNKLSEWKKQKKYLLNNLITGEIRTPKNMKINS
ncbi:MAG: hypothetical protein COU28_00580 [Candidatus Magasanikbacteria bacterium CG10_big_fil_rev_8_21_14_0_10_36_16]|uniref:Type I restriction modification DNA specificity domain-containing protein n=1 Tax=Candidatus Magasanikbacteria bacterium CG10_big_fil_rev_8_21_14_0_10_36_16 TaxID=1974645 RepID=A0A2H0TZJ3_9BACT|nr:MAG: hypothetical protein COU28_00580 [Candidatus Magasanikbacteria bacterium CG10_big_fil_rev_8_21_14_0_10_36_16]